MPVRFLSFLNDSALCADAVRSYTKNRLVRTLSPSINLFRAAAFSRQMSLFFKYHINGLLQGLWVSIVYAGGDDVFLVGAWNHTLQAALRIQKHPRSYTCGALTISASIAMFNEHYPIRAAAKQTAALEKLGILPDAVESAGKAALLLDRLNKRRDEGLTTPKQVRLLERYGFRHVGSWSFDAASRMINRIAAGGWRGVPKGVDPKTFTPDAQPAVPTDFGW